MKFTSKFWIQPDTTRFKFTTVGHIAFKTLAVYDWLWNSNTTTRQRDRPKTVAETKLSCKILFENVFRNVVLSSPRHNICNLYAWINWCNKKLGQDTRKDKLLRCFCVQYSATLQIWYTMMVYCPSTAVLSAVGRNMSLKSRFWQCRDCGLKWCRKVERNQQAIRKGVHCITMSNRWNKSHTCF